MDSAHPRYVSTPIAKELDSIMLAYAVLLVKEGIFDSSQTQVYLCKTSSCSAKMVVLGLKKVKKNSNLVMLPIHMQEVQASDFLYGMERYHQCMPVNSHAAWYNTINACLLSSMVQYHQCMPPKQHGTVPSMHAS
jgi:hypothetical protein